MKRQPEADAYIKLMEPGQDFTTLEFAKAIAIHPKQAVKLLASALERGLVTRGSVAAPIWTKV